MNTAKTVDFRLTKNPCFAKKGIVEPDGRCRKYSYDPLKRRPKKPLLVEKADPSEFEL